MSDGIYVCRMCGSEDIHPENGCSVHGNEDIGYESWGYESELDGMGGWYD